MGTYASEVVTIRFATVPPKPSSAPAENTSKTSSSQVAVTYSTTDTGGSPILAYHLQYGVGLSGGYSDLIPTSSNSMATAYTLTSVEQGQTYYFRFRVKNMYGWSEYSDIGYVVASQVPAQPNTPTIASFSGTQIVIDFDQSVDNKGSSITSYELYWASGTSPITFTQVTTYDGSSAQFILPSGTDTLTTGQIYNFKYAARNVRGLGELSEITSVAATSLLSSPTVLTKVAASSSGSKITLSWSASTPVNTPGDDILGYKLYVLDPTTSQYVKIFDGVENSSPSQTTFSYTSVTQGNQYSFKVSVVTFNGESSLSSAYTTYACSGPSGMAVPTIDDVTLTTISISWSAPSSTGGCALTGYAVYLDDGSGYSEVNTSSDPAVRNKPSLRTLTITALGSATSGSVVNVKVEAINSDSSVFSPAKRVLIATKPNAPTTQVQRVDSESDETKLTVEFATLSTSDINGSPIISYSLEVRTGTTGSFKVYSGANDISSMMTKFTLTSPWVSKGNTYSFRYRARNAYGWSDYSDISYLTVAGVPGTPSKLTMSSFSSTTIVIAIPTVLDDGGSDITSIEVEYADGLTSTSFPSCTMASSTCSIGTADGLTTGHIYKFRHKVTNTLGSSYYSDSLAVGLKDQPTAVTGLAKVVSLSTKTQIGLTWDLTPDTNSPAGIIRGYRVYMVNPSVSNDETLVYDGYGFSKTNYYTVSGLTTSNEYRFTVAAIDFNGEGIKSTEVTIYACTAPSGVPRPQKISSTSSQIVIQWGNVTDTGG